LSDSIYQRVIDLAGGNDAPIVVIPTADGAESYDQNAAGTYSPHTANVLRMPLYWLTRIQSLTGAASFRRLGATNVIVLHTYDPKEADTEEFTAPLIHAKGVWFGGGRQWRLVDAYAGTLSEERFQEVLDRNGVIGGSSAGASIQASFLARGDTASNQILVGDHQVGFGYLKNAAVDQHVLVRNRHFDMFQILKVRPELLGLSLDENTALIVSGNNAEVFGASYAIVYDGSFWSREGWDQKHLPEPSSIFYFLKAGDKYDLAARKVVV